MKKILLACLFMAASINVYAGYTDTSKTGTITALKSCDFAATAAYIIVKLQVTTNPDTYVTARLLPADGYIQPEGAKNAMVATLLAAQLANKPVTLGLDTLATADVECGVSMQYDIYEVTLGTF